MTYEALTGITGGRTVGLWRPNTEWRLPTGVTALLLGRTAAAWAANATTSSIPRAFTDTGTPAVVVDVPNWGNTTDLGNIDAALSWAAARGVDVARVVTVAVGRGGPAAVNWALRHHERVAAMHLISPVIDLTERYARVPADQASLNGAYGGSLATAASQWDPGQAHRRQQALFFFGDRTKVWFNIADTDTPAAVTEAWRAKVNAASGALPTTSPDSVPSAALVDTAVVADAGWDQQMAAVQQRRWHTLGQNAQWPIETGNQVPYYVFGDRHPVEINATTVAWLCNDLIIAGADDDDTYAGLPFRNGLIVENTATGEFTMPIRAASGTFPSAPGQWLVPDTSEFPNPGGIATSIYWPMHGVIEDGVMRVAATWVGQRGDPNAVNGVHLGTHIIDVDPVTWEQLDTAAAPVTIDDMVPVTQIADWGDGHWYIYGQHHSPPFQLPVGVTPSDYYLIEDGVLAPATWHAQDHTTHRVARVRKTAGLLAFDQWQYRTGTGWSDDPADVAPFKDTDGDDIVGDGSVAKIDGDYVYIAKALVDPDLNVYASRTPWGPWRHYDTITVPGSGVPRYSGDTIHSLTLWQEFCPHIPSPPGTCMATLQLQSAGQYQAVGDSVLIGNPFFVVHGP